jgi:hypothetical protein
MGSGLDFGVRISSLSKASQEEQLKIELQLNTKEILLQPH